MLFIYGTCYNNVNRIRECLESIKNINYSQIFIVDNNSTDGTYEFLEDNKNKYKLTLKRLKCNRGIGRQKAMEMAMEVSTSDDYLMTIDFDTVYDISLVNLINAIIIKQYKNCSFNNNLCLRDLNVIAWKPLNNGEDWERNADFIANGYKVFDMKTKSLNEPVIGNRDKRYAKGINYYYRIFKNAVELQKAWCFKSYNEYYQHVNNNKRIFMRLPYFLAKLQKNYCHDSVLNNNAYVKKNTINIETIEDIEEYLYNNNHMENK